MTKRHQDRNKLIFCLMIVFLSIILVPMTGSQPIEKEISVKMRSWFDGILISGWLGENGWYRSNVQITWNQTEPWVNHSYFKIDEGEWSEYTGPILLDTEGWHTVWMYCIDHGENHSDNATFGIDKTNPEITLTKESVGFAQVKFVTNVSDAVSGVWRVEFFVDDEPVFTDFEPPFESEVFWVGNHNVVAYVFDVAGNSEIAALSTPYVLEGARRHFNPMEMSTIISHLQKIIVVYIMVSESLS